MIPPGLLISAPSSGTGKTTLMLGLLAALRGQGVNVQPFKSGPDYIDPAFHTAASGRASFNLDSWSMDRAMIDGLVGNADGADLILAEGSMGLFDGVAVPGACGNGASADTAALMGWPVVLVLDVSGAAQSVAATALGFKQMRPDVTLAGVVLNRVASPRHETLVRVGMDQVGVRVLGSLPRRKEIEMPERHLGLVQAGEQENLPELLAEAAAFVAEHVDLDALRAAAAGTLDTAPTPKKITPPGQRIALARDDAFAFVYPHLLAGWRAAGAEVLPFSPLGNEAPDAGADVCWLPGGYPELHAGKLAAAETFRTGIQAFAQTKPVHGECGGYMAMGAGLVDKEGNRHQMTGLLGLETSFEKRKFHLGYRKADLNAAIPGHSARSQLRGHEFHYATILNEPDAPLAAITDSNDLAVPETGSVRQFEGGGVATGTFFHMIAEAT
ncbi:cobyrinate a,c-diamide synthase [Sulfitobacter mediterraneus]|uniref:cobyrinate a,c-diamide synthase n=1 Tax=Sulfitobacter mediterraneus TaxID=83219 RepID=UPI0019392BA9|nr:cobyrinate a,c-diamide synthase [Sulfitobacter mediterraneus]MBM1555206.1 cobyrinate a,c-diamide synthase [Sulfitobacter mediterraneus]MBM1567241.1 cobyrinate a,c-diamide synthase [Sulfitobacter mediterraneus]MBM1571043.1 cobyrinate a,c-diamide synthase [Sulfitobacter mediterraneus]MBM1574843.1 cobyrinate a,c-diamide synthase [Sulfitobacter mediterraneus]MBM1578164.1 cobyrinate a,c-diamide synthase [Sulfitobacter mediterraneus]